MSRRVRNPQYKHLPHTRFVTVRDTSATPTRLPIPPVCAESHVVERRSQAESVRGIWRRATGVQRHTGGGSFIQEWTLVATDPCCREVRPIIAAAVTCRTPRNANRTTHTRAAPRRRLSLSSNPTLPTSR